MLQWKEVVTLQLLAVDVTLPNWLIIFMQTAGLFTAILWLVVYEDADFGTRALFMLDLQILFCVQIALDF